jgi:hypothetical protein
MKDKTVRDVESYEKSFASAGLVPVLPLGPFALFALWRKLEKHCCEGLFTRVGGKYRGNSGATDQLVERLHGMQKVQMGSIVVENPQRLIKVRSNKIDTWPRAFRNQKTTTI